MKTPNYRSGKPDLSARLTSFLNSWAEANPPISPAPDKPPDLSQFQDFLPKVRSSLDAMKTSKRSGSAMNVWRAALLGRDELRHSAILAWLLDCKGDHGQGADVLVRLLRHLEPTIENQQIGRDQFPRASHIGDRAYWTSVENCPTGERENRVDIRIYGDDFLLFIEVKIDVGETNNQLDRYLDIGQSLSRSRPWGVIYLTPHGGPPQYSDNQQRLARNHPNLIFASWRDVGIALNEHAAALPDLCFSRLSFAQLASWFISISSGKELI